MKWLLWEHIGARILIFKYLQICGALHRKVCKERKAESSLGTSARKKFLKNLRLSAVFKFKKDTQGLC
jgi:hypothetical protein